MSLLGFQQALSELVMSPEFCSTVKTNPERALSGFDLTPLEHQRLAILATQLGLSVGTMIHRSFRLSMLVSTLPKTCTLLESHGFKEIVHAYWRTQLPRNFYFEQEAARFGEYMFAQLKLGSIQSEFLEEILRFELAVLSLTLGSREQGAGSRGSREVGELGEQGKLGKLGELGHGDPQTDFPYLNPQYRIVFFRHEPEILLQALDEGRMPEHVTEGNYYLLLARSFENQLQIKRVGPRLGELLSACDGHSSVVLLCKQLSIAVRDLEVLAEKGYIFFKSSCDRAIAASA